MAKFHTVFNMDYSINLDLLYDILSLKSNWVHHDQNHQSILFEQEKLFSRWFIFTDSNFWENHVQGFGLRYTGLHHSGAGWMVRSFFKFINLC